MPLLQKKHVEFLLETLTDPRMAVTGSKARLYVETIDALTAIQADLEREKSQAAPTLGVLKNAGHKSE